MADKDVQAWNRLAVFPDIISKYARSERVVLFNTSNWVISPSESVPIRAEMAFTHLRFCVATTSSKDLETI